MGAFGSGTYSSRIEEVRFSPSARFVAIFRLSGRLPIRTRCMVIGRTRANLAACSSDSPASAIQRLEAARLAWIDETKDPAEKEAREKDGDFLRSRNSDGEHLDFHALRHSFLSRLGRAGASPKVMQSMARHSTVTLTMDRYAHVALHDLDAAVNSMPALPVNHDRAKLLATGS